MKWLLILVLQLPSGERLATTQLFERAGACEDAAFSLRHRATGLEDYEVISARCYSV